MLPIDPPVKPRPTGSDNLAEHAAHLVDTMLNEENEEERQRLARCTLGYHLEAIDAYVVLAELAGSWAEALALLREAIRIGNRQWSAALAGKEPVEWWSDRDTRPFMRAIMAYGRVLAEVGQPDQAELCFKALLDMQPQDSLGAEEALEKLRAPESGLRR